jgi:hypothetical protein
MKGKAMNSLKLVYTVTFLIMCASPVYAGCSDFTEGSIGHAPRVTLCYKGKCDDTTLDILCGNAFRSNIQYANGLIIYITEGKNQTPEFYNNLGKKMRAKDWTCKAINTSPGIDPCIAFHLHSTGPDD